MGPVLVVAHHAYRSVLVLLPVLIFAVAGGSLPGGRTPRTWGDVLVVVFAVLVGERC